MATGRIRVSRAASCQWSAISATGRFHARWQLLDLNRAYGSQWLEESVSAETLLESAFGVDLVQPVDLYQQAERSVKYGGLFIALSLLTLFLWEHLARRPLHPIQYGLMGLALSVFYLLLLALAEHIGFTLAYVVAAVALCGLLGVYLAGAFRSSRAGGGSAVAFGAMYALLYLLVTSEDYALLAGALGLFAILATVMVVTRRLDWYDAGAKLGRRAPASLDDDPARDQRGDERNHAQPEQRAHDDVAGPTGSGRHQADHGGSQRRDDAADVVAEARAHRAQARGKQLGQIEHEGAEHAVHADAHGERACAGARLATVSSPNVANMHRRRIHEVGDEHRAAAHHLRQGNGRERAEQAAEVESVRRLRLPALRQHARRIAGDPGLRGVLVGECGAEQRHEGVTRPPGKECRDGRDHAADRVRAHVRA